MFQFWYQSDHPPSKYETNNPPTHFIIDQFLPRFLLIYVLELDVRDGLLGHQKVLDFC